MKLIAMLAITFSAHCVENNAFVFFDRDENMLPIIIMEFNEHYYEIGDITHYDHCPCVEN